MKEPRLYFWIMQQSRDNNADVMKRIAVPMVGGLLTSTILTLLIIPAIYAIWKGRGLAQCEEKE